MVLAHKGKWRWKRQLSSVGNIKRFFNVLSNSYIFKLQVRGDRGRASHNLLVIPTLPAYDLTTLKFTTTGPGKPARETVQISKDNEGKGISAFEKIYEKQTHPNCSRIQTLSKEQYRTQFGLLHLTEIISS